LIVPARIGSHGDLDMISFFQFECDREARTVVVTLTGDVFGYAVDQNPVDVEFAYDEDPGL